MRILVTAGGTREPIDAVRVIANTSTGRLGACIVDEARRRGHDVVHLHGVHAARPESEGESHVFDASSELSALLTRLVPGADAVIHAAAVSDFLPDAAAGKLSSDRDELVLRLRRAPKLIDALRSLCPGGLLVGFKLTSGLEEVDQVQVARRLLERARLDLVVANDASAVGERDHRALIVDAGGVVDRCTGKAGIAEALVRRVSLPAGVEGA